MSNLTSSIESHKMDRENQEKQIQYTHINLTYRETHM